MNFTPRVLANASSNWVSILTLDGCVALVLTVQAFAAGVTEPSMMATSPSIAFANQLLGLLTAAVGLVGAVTGVWTLVRAGQIKKDVNSQFSALKAELAQSKAETSALRQVIASKPGATSEEQMRAVIAKEQQAMPAPLPKDTPPTGGSS